MSKEEKRVIRATERFVKLRAAPIPENPGRHYAAYNKASDELASAVATLRRRGKK